jgi:hypothetical protein
MTAMGLPDSARVRGTRAEGRAEAARAAYSARCARGSWFTASKAVRMDASTFWSKPHERGFVLVYTAPLVSVVKPAASASTRM